MDKESASIIPPFEVLDYARFDNPEEAKVHSVIDYLWNNFSGKMNRNLKVGKMTELVEKLESQNHLGGTALDLMNHFNTEKIDLEPKLFHFLAAIAASPDNELPTNYLKKHFLKDNTIKQYVFDLRAKIEEANMHTEHPWRLTSIFGDNFYASNMIKEYPHLGNADDMHRFFGNLLRLERPLSSDLHSQQSLVASTCQFDTIPFHESLISKDHFVSIVNRTKVGDHGDDYYLRELSGYERLFLFNVFVYNPYINLRYPRRVGVHPKYDSDVADSVELGNFFLRVTNPTLVGTKKEEYIMSLKDRYKLVKYNIRQSLLGYYSKDVIEGWGFFGKFSDDAEQIDP